MPNGSWCWFSDPRAILSSKNRTYIGYQASNGDICARVIDHMSNTDTITVLHGAYPLNDHYNPSLIELTDGRIVLFYSTPGSNNDLIYRMTNTTGDLSTLGPEIAMGVSNYVAGQTSVGYFIPVYLSAENRLMVFFQPYTASGNPWAVVNNFNQLATNSWSGYELWSVANSSTYLKVASNGIDKVDLLLTDGHPQEKQTSVYNARFFYDGSAAHWQNSAGVNIVSVPFGTAQATKVLDGPTFGNTWIHQAAYDTIGCLVALTVTYPNNNGNDQHYRHCRLSSGTWSSVEICKAGSRCLDDGLPGLPLTYYSGGACFDGNDASKVYLSVQDPATGWRIDQWQTADFGATWALAKNISPSDLVRKKFRPFSPKGYGSATVSLIYWDGRYTFYNNFDAMMRTVGWAAPADQQLIEACYSVESDVGSSPAVVSMAGKLRALYS